MSVPYRPQLWWQCCFNADPNDIGAVPLWTDVTTMIRKVSQNRRGRQYELGQSMGAQPVITWRDPNEYVNPANTSSPYYPNVQPYRQFLGQAMWPNEGTGNLINTGRWRGNNEVASDPSFEAYVNGAAMPNWLTAVGATVPTITTTNPQQGTKSLTYAVAATATRQGVSWEADCVPGQQYTTSAYMRQSTGSTQRLLVDDQTLAYDNFGRSASSGWGTADFGGAWSNAGGSASDFSVSSGAGKHSIGTLNVRRFTYVGSVLADANITATIQCPTLVTGTTAGTDVISAGLHARYADVDNHYRAEIAFNLDGIVSSLSLSKRVAGVTTSLGTQTGFRFLPYTSGQQIRLRLEVTGTTVRAKFWAATNLEPTAWGISVTDTAISAPGAVGCHTIAASGVTNALPVVVNFDQLMCSGSLASTTTTTSGSYVRLTSTFTATQPRHTISVSTLGTATAGTINIDAIQHEPGASATTFTTSGPVIYPILRDYVERWTRKWASAGFEGIALTPAVDGFAALNAISIDSDYVMAVRDSFPSYYWILGGGENTTQAAETSGNNGPYLSRFDSKYGPGNAPVFGVAIEIPGAASATGVQFLPTVAGGSDQPGSTLSLGHTPATPGIRFPFSYGTTTWAASVSCWTKLNNNGQAQQIVAPVSTVSGVVATSPIAIIAQGTFGGIDFLIITQSPTGAQASVLGPALASTTAGVSHHIVGTITQTSGGDTVLKIYMDGILEATTTVTTASLGGYYNAPATILAVGGGSNGTSVVDGVVRDVVLWDRELTTAEVTALWTAGGLGNAGELTGTRITRHFTSGPYAGATRISAGSTTLQPPSWPIAIDLLGDAQNNTVAEDGTFWIAPDGAAVFEGRQDRWLRTTSLFTLGEDTAGGETPYLDGVEFDLDPAFVVPYVRVTRNNGGTAAGGLLADVQTAIRKFFGRSYSEGSDYADEIQAQYKADWVFYSHRAPILRVSAITIDPASSTIAASLWPVALSLEVGKRVTVKRRAKAANASVGITMSGDYFVETVAHSDIDMDKGEWTISYLLSPIGQAPDVTLQPWILEDATYGVLGTTTVLGW